jgi:hypothetical protein
MSSHFDPEKEYNSIFVFAVFLGDCDGNFNTCQIVDGNGEILETVNPQISDVEAILGYYRLRRLAEYALKALEAYEPDAPTHPITTKPKIKVKVRHRGRKKPSQSTLPRFSR